MEPETLGGLRDKGLDIFAYCNRCHHNGVVSTVMLLAQLGPGHAVPAVGSRLVCASCGARDIATRPNWSNDMGTVARHLPCD